MKNIYADGACKGNPGVGGWGIVIFQGDNNEVLAEKYGYGGQNTTNIRMEMTAILEALKITKENEPITIYTDSDFSIKAITQWISGWKKKNWKTAKGDDVKNKDLWLEIEKHLEGKNVKFQWVKGHSGNYGNDYADRLANLGASGKNSD